MDLKVLFAKQVLHEFNLFDAVTILLEIPARFFAVTSPCPLVSRCGSNGDCKDGICICSAGYEGKYCNQGIM